MAESMADELGRANLLRFLRYGDETFLVPVRRRIRQNTIAYLGPIIVTWVGAFIHYLVYGWPWPKTVQLIFMVLLLLSIVSGMAWVITVPSYLLMYVKQRRRIKHCTHLITTGAPIDEVFKYVTSFLVDMRWKKVAETL